MEKRRSMEIDSPLMSDHFPPHVKPVPSVSYFSQSRIPSESLTPPINGNNDYHVPPPYPPPPRKSITELENERRVPSLMMWAEDWWGFEILSVILGIGAVIALCIVLRQYDGKPQPQLASILGARVTLNAIVSLLGLVAKASLMIPIVECISQLKWNYYKDGQKPLLDFLHFDNASRGPWGSIRLIWRLRGVHLAVLGALLTILALAIDPFIQQSIQYTTEMHPDPFNSNAVTHFVDRWDESNGNTLPVIYPSQNTIGEIYSGALSWNDTGAALTDVAPICSTGNCTWPSYASLGLCGRVLNVSEHLSIQDIGWEVDDPNFQPPVRRATLPGGQYVDIIQAYTGNNGPVLNVSTAINFDPNYFNATSPNSTSIAFTDIRYPLANFFTIWQNQFATYAEEPMTEPRNRSLPLTDEFRAVEAVLEWCVQTYDTDVTDGRATTTLSSNPKPFTPFTPDPDPADPAFSMNGSLIAFPSPSNSSNSNNNNTPAAAPGSASNFSIGYTTHAGLQQYLGGLFTGAALAGGGNAGAVLTTMYNAGEGTIPNDAVRALRNALWAGVYDPTLPIPPIEDQTTAASSLAGMGLREPGLDGAQRLLDNVAVAMANRMRRASRTDVSGEALAPVTLVRVQWEWLVVLFVFVVGTLGFFCATVVHERGAEQLWKSSALAVLHAMEPAAQRTLSGVVSTTGMGRQAGEVRVMLRDRGRGLRLS